jgi:hypothetical protein
MDQLSPEYTSSEKFAINSRREFVFADQKMCFSTAVVDGKNGSRWTFCQSFFSLTTTDHPTIFIPMLALLERSAKKEEKENRVDVGS